MQRVIRAVVVLVVTVCSLAPPASLFAAGPTAKPEDVGLSSERLKRVAELVQRHIAAGSFSGAVTLVARNGRIVQHEAGTAARRELRVERARGDRSGRAQHLSV